VPDLAVEIISPSNSAEEMERKIAEYFLAGALRVWVVYPETARLYAYDSPTSVRILTRDDVLVDEAILPGFRLNLAEFLAPPEE
jgi:Uma2 family endonuclease